MNLSSESIAISRPADRRAGDALAFPPLVDSLPGLCWVLSAVGELLHWNRPFAALFGLGEETAVAAVAAPAVADHFALFAPADRAALSRWIARVHETGQASTEASPAAAAGRYLLSGRRVEQGGIVRLVCLGIELAPGQADKADTVAARSPAEQQLCALNAELRERAAQAEAAARAKSFFLAHMSHEIRTPMNAVLGFAQMGLRESAGRRVQPAFQRILDSGQHLLGVINDILDYSKIEAGKLVVETIPFVLGEAVDRAVALTAARAYAAGLRFRVAEAADLPERLPGDAVRLTQVLVNLLANAIKFTERGSVTLELACLGERLLIRVRDTGIGMSEAQLERLFQPFEQADSSTTRRFGGSGLGLAISRRIVIAMGGELSVASAPGRGSCFEIDLPGLDGGPAPVAADCAVCLVGGADDSSPLAGEFAELADDLRRRGVRVDTVRFADLFAAPVAARLLLAAEQLSQLPLPWPAGLRPLVATTPGVALAVPEAMLDQVVAIERPLRARQVIAALVEPPPAPRCVQQRLAGWRVLAAEDTDLNRVVLEDLLVYEGATVCFAENGREALDLLEERGVSAFDVVLMDVQMPVMDGYAATRHLRTLAPALPVIGLTAHALGEERERTLAAGMVECVTKPIDAEFLIAAMHRHGRTGLSRLQRRHNPCDDCLDRPRPAAGLVDWPALAEIFNGRQAFIDRLIDTLLECHRETPEKLRRAASAGDFEAMAFLAHALKSTAGNVKAHRVRVLAAHVERLARSADRETAGQAGVLATLVEALHAELTSSRAPDAKFSRRRTT